MTHPIKLHELALKGVPVPLECFINYPALFVTTFEKYYKELHYTDLSNYNYNDDQIIEILKAWNAKGCLGKTLTQILQSVCVGNKAFEYILSENIYKNNIDLSQISSKDLSFENKMKLSKYNNFSSGFLNTNEEDTKKLLNYDISDVVLANCVNVRAIDEYLSNNINQAPKFLSLIKRLGFKRFNYKTLQTLDKHFDFCEFIAFKLLNISTACFGSHNEWNNEWNNEYNKIINNGESDLIEYITYNLHKVKGFEYELLTIPAVTNYIKNNMKESEPYVLDMLKNNNYDVSTYIKEEKLLSDELIEILLKVY